MYKYIYILLYLIVSISMTEYGEFDLHISSYEDCKGPKRNNCSRSTTQVVDSATLIFDFYALEDMTIIKGKILGMLNNKELVRLQLKNICDHIFFKPLFQLVFKQNDRCGITKGHYAIRANIAEISYKFYGGKFMYGNWSFSTLFYNDYCNLHCSHINLILTPKKSSSNSSYKNR